MENLERVFFFVRITVIVKQHDYTTEPVANFFWDRMSAESRKRWDWYFKYRAALLQVMYPRYHVEFVWGTYSKPTDEMIIAVRNQWISAKRKVTEYENKLQKAKDNWNEIFPIEEDVRYKNTVKYIDEKKSKVFLLRCELDDLEKKKQGA